MGSQSTTLCKVKSSWGAEPDEGSESQANGIEQENVVKEKIPEGHRNHRGSRGWVQCKGDDWGFSLRRAGIWLGRN